MTIPADPPISVIVGTGYTGLRVLNEMPAGDALGINRSPIESTDREVFAVDFDAPSGEGIDLPGACTLLYTVPPSADSTEDRRLASFLDRIRSTPRRIVYLSTSGVYGDRQGDVTLETDPTNPSTDRARRRLDSEQKLERWCGTANSELIVLRVSGIYGPGRLDLERLREGAPIICERDTGPGNRIHVDDLVLCCIAAMTEGAPPGVYNVADGDHRSNYWFTRTTAELAGLPLPPEISLREAKQSWSKKRVSFLTESRQLGTQKMRDALNVPLRYENAEDGIRASLAEEQA